MPKKKRPPTKTKPHAYASPHTSRLADIRIAGRVLPVCVIHRGGGEGGERATTSCHASGRNVKAIDEESRQGGGDKARREIPRLRIRRERRGYRARADVRQR